MGKDRNHIYNISIYTYSILYSFFILFWYISLGYYKLIFQQTFVIIIYISCHILSQKGKTKAALLLSTLIVIFFTTLSSIQFGYTGGAHVYILLLIALVAISEKLGKASKIKYSIFLLFLFAGLFLFMGSHTPIYILPKPWNRLMRELHQIISFAILTLSFSRYGTAYVKSEKEWLNERKSILEKTYRDSLTGIYNRRFLEKYMDEFGGRTNDGCKIVAMVDIDNFKKINDSYGHDIGDIVIKEVVNRFNSNLRGDDLIGRWGGEEFLILLNECSLERGVHIIDRLRHMVAVSPIIIPGGKELDVSVTIGISKNASNSSWMETIKEADSYLYIGKKTGKNKVSSVLDQA